MQSKLVLSMLCACGLVASYANADSYYRGFDVGNGSTALANPVNSLAARDAFVAALTGNVGVQNFEGFAINAPAPANWDFAPGVSGSFSNSASVASSVRTGLDAVGTYPAQGTRYLYSETNPGSTFFTLMFNQQVNAVGFFIADMSDWLANANVPGPIFIELLNAQQAVVGSAVLSTTLVPAQNPSHGMNYFGVISDAGFYGFRIVQPLRANGANTESDGIGIDEVTIAIIPAPGSLGLLALAGLWTGRRRHR